MRSITILKLKFLQIFLFIPILFYSASLKAASREDAHERVRCNTPIVREPAGLGQWYVNNQEVKVTGIEHERFVWEVRFIHSGESPIYDDAKKRQVLNQYRKQAKEKAAHEREKRDSAAAAAADRAYAAKEMAAARAHGRAAESDEEEDYRGGGAGRSYDRRAAGGGGAGTSARRGGGYTAYGDDAEEDTKRAGRVITRAAKGYVERRAAGRR